MQKLIGNNNQKLISSLHLILESQLSPHFSLFRDMKENIVFEIVAKALREPSFKTIESSQLECGYTSTGFNPNHVKYHQGRSSTDAYPKVTFQYLNALFNPTNLNAPTEAPNLYLPVPGNPEKGRGFVSRSSNRFTSTYQT